MFLKLFRVQGVRHWHDLCVNQFSEDGEWLPDSGSDPFDFFVWGLSEEWVLDRYEGGYSSRKDSDVSEITSVTRCTTLPELFPCENSNTLDEWYSQVKFSAPYWATPLLRPRYFWNWKWNLKHVWRRLSCRQQQPLWF